MQAEVEIEIIAGSARETVALAIRRRQLLAEESVLITDLALHFGVEAAEHRTARTLARGTLEKRPDIFETDDDHVAL